MFGFTYKLTTVNPEKNIVRLTPTLSTWMKAFAPSFVVWGVLAVLFLIGSKMEERDTDTDEETATS